MRLIVEAGQGHVGLGLQVDGLDPPLGLGAELRHPSALQKVRDKRGDEDGLARAGQAGDAKAQGGVEEGFGQGGARALDPAGDPVRQSGKCQGLPPVVARTKIGRCAREW